ncbi:MAG: hypothetical protein V1815_01710 [Candidatus Woesearchaeota archaeon]
MATLLQPEILKFVMPVVVLIFIFAIIWGILSKLKLFGDNASANAAIALIIAFLFILMPNGMELIQFMTPWVVIFLVVLMFILFFLMFLGIKEEALAGAAKSTWFIVIIIIIIVVLFIVSAGKVFSGFFTGFHTGFWGSVFTAKTLTVVFLIFVTSYAVRLIGR